MRMIIGNQSDWVVRWVGEQLDCTFSPRDYGIAIVYRDVPIAGVVYHDWTDHNTFISIATTSPHWASKFTLRAIFGYAFNQMGVTRVSAIIRGGNRKWRKTLINRLGFVPECKVEGWFGEHDGYLLRMKRNECKWIEHGQGQFEKRRAAV